MSKQAAIKLPPVNQRRVIEEMLVLLPDPVEKLTLLKRVMGSYGRIPAIYRLYPRLAEVALRKQAIDFAEKIRPGSKKNARTLMAEGTIPTPKPVLWRIYQFRHAILTLFILVFGWGLGSAVAALFDLMQAPPQVAGVQREIILADNGARIIYTGKIPPFTPDTKERNETGKILVAEVSAPAVKPMTGDVPLPAAPVLRSVAGPAPVEIKMHLAGMLASLEGATTHVPEYLTTPVWLVEKKGDTEIYSNRLQIITSHMVSNTPRRYLSFPRGDKNQAAGQTQDKIVGIVYHASESDIFPFNPEMNSSLKRYSASLIKYIKRNKSYHYFIDRFGRVYRIVRDADAAHHAGNSIWADAQQYHLNLNNAFIGICFEGRDFEPRDTTPTTQGSEISGPHMVAMSNPTITKSQLQSGKELTAWLRYKYGIHQHNCVPHGLVSINPANNLIGHHLDLAHSFPFSEFGLSNKYLETLPSMTEFGFTHDKYLTRIFNGQLWPGVHLSRALVKQRARKAGISRSKLQRQLQAKFKSMTEVMDRFEEEMENMQQLEAQDDRSEPTAQDAGNAS